MGRVVGERERERERRREENTPVTVEAVPVVIQE
jgi:hypothetical protein